MKQAIATDTLAFQRQGDPAMPIPFMNPQFYRLSEPQWAGGSAYYMYLSGQTVLDGKWNNGCLYVSVQTPWIELDADSDNTGQLNGTKEEDKVEDEKAGMLVIVNRDDDDQDGILDFADGFNGLSGTGDDVTTGSESDLHVVTLEIPRFSGNAYQDAKITFSYDAAMLSDVSRNVTEKPGLDGETYETYDYVVGDGLLRLWREPGDAARADKFIEPDHEYTLSDLNLTGGGKLNLYLEAVNGSAEATTIDVTLTLPGGGVATDVVRILPFDPLIELQESEIEGFNIVRNNSGSLSLEGTAGRDIILGTTTSEVIYGRGGDDIIITGGGEDYVEPGAGTDVVFPFFGTNKINGDSQDEVSYIEGTLIGDRDLTYKSAQQQSRPGGGAASMAATVRSDQKFSSEDIIAAYKWAFGRDDIWFAAFEAGGGKVLAVEGDGGMWTYWDVDWVQNHMFGPWVGFNVKIQYNIGTVLDAAMALRQAILTKVALWHNNEFENHIQDIFANPKADVQTFDQALLTWQDMRARQAQYATEAAELAAGLYFESMTMAAGPGGDIISAIIEFPQAVSDAAAIGSKALDLLRKLPGKITDWLADAPPDEGPLLEDGVVPAAGAAAAALEGEAALAAAAAPSPRVLFKLAGFGEFRAWRDVIQPIVRTATGAPVSMPFGFVWRNRPSFKVNPHVNANTGLTTLLLGTPQKVIANGVETTHAATVNRIAKSLVDNAPANKRYLYIGQNLSLRTMLDSGALQAGTRVFENQYFKHRPDVFAVYYDVADGKMKVELHEILSEGNKLPEVQAALNGIEAQIAAKIGQHVQVTVKQTHQLDP